MLVRFKHLIHPYKESLSRSLQRGIYFVLRCISPLLTANLGLTCSGKRDGGGAQIHACLSVLLFAHDFGIKYLHSPFLFVEHRPSTLSNQEWCNEWNSLFKELPIDIPFEYLMIDSDACQSEFSLWFVLRLFACKGSDRLLYSIQHAHLYADLFPDRYGILCKSVVQRAITGSVPLQIVAHLRRGDVCSSGPYASRFTSSLELLGALRAIVKRYYTTYTSVRIYSQEQCVELELMKPADYVVDLECSPTDAIRAMMKADIFVMAKSSMSYVAAIFCRGSVYYQDFSHSPMSRWTVLDPHCI